MSTFIASIPPMPVQGSRSAPAYGATDGRGNRVPDAAGTAAAVDFPLHGPESGARCRGHRPSSRTACGDWNQKTLIASTTIPRTTRMTTLAATDPFSAPNVLSARLLPAENRNASSAPTGPSTQPRATPWAVVERNHLTARLASLSTMSLRRRGVYHRTGSGEKEAFPTGRPATSCHALPEPPSTTPPLWSRVCL